MAYYKYPQILRKLDNGEFDKLYSPATYAPWSGIYRCEVCGKEAVSTDGKPLPPQNHHQHPQGQPIRWRLIVTDAA